MDKKSLVCTLLIVICLVTLVGAGATLLMGTAHNVLLAMVLVGLSFFGAPLFFMWTAGIGSLGEYFKLLAGFAVLLIFVGILTVYVTSLLSI